MTLPVKHGYEMLCHQYKNTNRYNYQYYMQSALDTL